ncbi:RICIN domain-containing protein [Streptomyces radiopugnans]|uniref:Ricin-type beta-trefoil lectin domain-like n=1 Tax=Streptomyces radiopugnans TaxID=403935 RepID=A0A1H9EHU2_9ACTN|nr:RICIN domain-containing protein [Streptomyces radiopugnans]SEQ25336.1 Ricin-type beta-trefoil lectin domain-like [Streptomyces radiopugnans]
MPAHSTSARPRSRLRGLYAAASAALLAAVSLVALPAQDADAAEIDTSAYYQLVSRHSGKAIDVFERSTDNGASVVQWTPGTGANQQFRFVPSGDGWYRIAARHSGKVLDVEARSTADGANVVQWTDNDSANQQFRVADSDGGHVRLINRHSGKALDVWEWSTADGARISQYTDTGGHNQQWRLVEVGGGDGGSGEPPAGNAKQMEDLNRGLVSVRSGTGNLVSWRLLGTESRDTAFNLYRGGTKVNSSPITGSTNHLDAGAPADASYTVRAVVNGAEQAASAPSLRFTGGDHLDVPLSRPSSTHTPVEASPGDLDGDGQYELVVKWDPDNAKDNSQSGTTGNVYIDAYRLSGQRLWRIDLGRNIRAGAHYTQFQVYDYDGDGRAEVAMKTADATRDGRGTVIGNASADHRNSSGYVLTGPEYLTMFDGLTGAALDTVNYEPGRGNVSSWGDSYGNRVDRFLAGTAYLDGTRPSLIMARGYYTRATIAAWDFRDGKLTRRWLFDSNASGNGAAYGQGNHQLSVADVDSDGRQEIVYGSATVDDNGTLMYATGFGHGDALHVGDFAPSRPGLEVFTIHEPGNQPGSDLHDARTGQVIHRTPTSGSEGPGRGAAGDIYAGNAGAEFWGSGPNMDRLRNASGGEVGRNPSSANFLAWWDGDPVRELLDGTRIDKYGTGGETRLLTGSGVASSNGTKSTPVLSGDLFGDWREEVIWRHGDNSALRIYATTATTGLKLHTLVHDAQYRVALAWQNTAYNQPPHPSFFLGQGMSTPPQPNVYLR